MKTINLTEKWLGYLTLYILSQENGVGSFPKFINKLTINALVNRGYIIPTGVGKYQIGFDISKVKLNVFNSIQALNAYEIGWNSPTYNYIDDVREFIKQNKPTRSEIEDNFPQLTHNVVSRILNIIESSGDLAIRYSIEEIDF